MSDEAEVTSFDALAHEHNLSDRWRDLARIFFKAGVGFGRGFAGRLSDDDIIAARDELLPSQGQPFDILAFARVVIARAREKSA